MLAVKIKERKGIPDQVTHRYRISRAGKNAKNAETLKKTLIRGNKGKCRARCGWRAKRDPTHSQAGC